ncbi:hypothetical protein WAZ07_14880 [Bacillus sp. FJAT-51639]|uniref:Uncharacterized protein n=1 Tax=Bacillus bruguierae TaxID=3127667 RepID=A0ABU8FIQ5_9BACI
MKREKRKRRWYRYVIQLIVMALIVSSIPIETIAETMNNDKPVQESEISSTGQAKETTEQKQTSDEKPTEVVEERTEHEKVFDNKNGTFTKKVYTEPIHTEKNGKLEEIQPELVTKTTETIETKTTKLKTNVSKKVRTERICNL